MTLFFTIVAALFTVQCINTLIFYIWLNEPWKKLYRTRKPQATYKETTS